ncbi:MAG: M6 family metalloprotease domain-containing protein [Acidobacteria bacterium]|nr:M6 family metalloprotease domain-containing protein [Acidobacteriota bacterium]
MACLLRFLGILLLLLPWAATVARATVPPRKGVKWPKAYPEWVRKGRHHLSTRAYVPWVQRLHQNRRMLRAGTMTIEAASTAGGTAVAGTRTIPVLLAKYSNTGSDPYPPANLQQELFGSFPTGTMTDYYREISYGRLTVTGTVAPWKTLAHADTFYEGGTGCNGICGSSKVGDLLKETLDLNDPTIDFSQFDNDGPDGIPNSGDDDGFVDFVAFVHPESGGECGNSNVWSHRSTYDGWTGADYVTKDAKFGGGFIKIHDYVIMPSRACDGSTMIQIGVFCHEFGHAFGLPDLYDTDRANGDSAGIGNWCLMASGSWGGDGASPERPTHMSAWSKQFLGWITPADVTADMRPAAIASMEDNPSAFKLVISPDQYYLISYRRKTLFDAKLPEAGLLIMKINETVVNAGLATNRVNADSKNKGVGVIEADGKNEMDANTNRGDAGDVFPGSTAKRTFDNSSNPKSQGSAAVCNIGDPGASAGADLMVSAGACPGAPPPPPPKTCSALFLFPENGPGQTMLDGMLMLLPVVMAAVLAMLRRRKTVLGGT